MNRSDRPREGLDPKVQKRARRMDRFMALFISVGGLAIIATVLGMMVFIGKEALPLFGSAKSAILTSFSGSGSDVRTLSVDESGKAAVFLSLREGLSTRRLADGTPLAKVPGGPALPWLQSTDIQPKGEVLVLGSDHTLGLATLSWQKNAGEDNPAAWTLDPHWQGALALKEDLAELLHFRVVEAEGLGGGNTLRFVALAPSGLVWAEAALDATAPLELKSILLPDHGKATCAVFNRDGRQLFVGTEQGKVLNIQLEGGEAAATAEFGEPITALGLGLGENALLVGGAHGKLAAYQMARVGEGFTLQTLHAFAPMKGAVRGFAHGLRDKRFLAWSQDQVVVDHLTTEGRLFSYSQGAQTAGLSPRGDVIFACDPKSACRVWSLNAPHADVNARNLFGKIHYEGYSKPDYVWQSTGGTDDFEPKYSLIPLLFGTLKGTLYAMLFAVPLAVFAALYTSQFATVRLRNTVKPLVEIMAALPSVVLGFLAGLVLAPLFEKLAVEIFVLPMAILLCALLAMPLWGRLPSKWRTIWGQGREVLWMIPLLLVGLLVALKIGPAFEQHFLGGSYRTWLQGSHGIIYDQRNSLVVGFAMGFAVIPIIFTISEDALGSVPKSLTSASLACGASPWQTAWRVVLPTASPGIFSALMVGFGRAIGETMIVLMATGNTPVMDWSPFNGMRTLAANIAVEIPEAPHHGSLYRVLFLAAFLLFALTFLLNTLAELVRQRLRKRYESF